jgi:hypothetical protein
MSDYFGSLADENSPGVFVNDDLLGANNLFDFDAASEEVDSYGYRDISTTAEEEHFNDLSDDNDSLYSVTISSAKDVDDKELGEEEDGMTRADSVLLWKIEHSTGDHKLKSI